MLNSGQLRPRIKEEYKRYHDQEIKLVQEHRAELGLNGEQVGNEKYLLDNINLCLKYLNYLSDVQIKYSNKKIQEYK